MAVDKLFRALTLVVLILLVTMLTLFTLLSPRESDTSLKFCTSSVHDFHKTTAQECPDSMKLDSTPYDEILENMSASQPKDPLYDENVTYTERIVILTPISSVARSLKRYFQNLCSLTYPHDLLSVVLGEDSSTDDTYNVARQHLHTVEKYFHRVKLTTSSESMSVSYNRRSLDRHLKKHQLPRRRHLAKIRNNLLIRGLQDEDWVLWLDSDVRYLPPDIIQRLLSAKKEIVAPACMTGNKKGWRIVNDLNTWKETNKSREFLQRKPDDFLMLEGYDLWMRKYLIHLRKGKHVVEIDGVGGCVLLIKGDLHRQGLIFPTFIFKNQIETEGLARMAQSMGYKLYGMPYLEVYHM